MTIHGFLADIACEIFDLASLMTILQASPMPRRR
jgi:hypothetical protein